MLAYVFDLVYLLAAVLFIQGIKMLASPKTALAGNYLSALAMALTVGTTLLSAEIRDYTWILAGVAAGTAAGAIWAQVVPMTAMPQMVAIFNGLGGAASALVGVSEYFRNFEGLDALLISVILLSLLVGGVTFSGSVVAYLKLEERIPGRPIVYPGQNAFNAALLVTSLAVGLYMVVFPDEPRWFLALGGASLVLGILMVLPIGGADMPVVIALLNSFSGIAVSFAGFVLSSNVLIISGSLVGASGIFLTNAMCVAMNRSIWNVLFGAFGQLAGGGAPAPASGASPAAAPQGAVKAYTIEDATTILQHAGLVIIVPGFGMAAAQAQHAVRELTAQLERLGVTVKYAIHPVAGRMPGHMNVLLAEANVPYEQLFDMDQINDEFRGADVALVVGANDVVNPAANEDASSPIYGMPILKAEEARTVMVLKRSMNPGFAGIENRLFLHDNTMMLFGDAKSTLQKLTEALKQAG
jgi:NAD(P) transhydrogenase subunit beta